MYLLPFDKLDGIHVTTDVLQQARNEFWIRHRVRNQIFPQIVVVFILHKLDGLRGEGKKR